MKNLLLYIISILFLAFVFDSCKKSNEMDPASPTGLITNVEIIFSTSGSAEVIFRYNDIDGPGGNDPLISSGVLQSNTIYQVSIQILNEQSNPVNFIHSRIANESENYQLFYKTSPLLNIYFTYNDQDGNGNPIGLNMLASTGPVSNGAMNVTLRHNLDKGATGVSDGDQTQAGGDEDFDIDFNINID